MIWSAVLPFLKFASAVPTERNNGPIGSHQLDDGLDSTPLTTLSNLGPYSPFLSQESGICRDVPEGYKIDQVQIYARHGARNPTASALKKIQGSVAKVANRTSSLPEYAFLDGYYYGNGIKADQLTDFGRKELWTMGKRYKEEYASVGSPVFVRAASDGRVVESGRFFLQGFNGDDFDLKATLPNVDVIIYEGDNMNNTLDISTCTADENLDPGYGDVAEANWLKVFAPPIADRFNAALGSNISGSDVTNLISLCSFESLKGNIWIESPWCKLFTETEFKGNEYYYDLSKFYDHSWGSPYGRVSGIGLVNEIIARLEEKPVLLGSGTNSTLDTDPKTFPLGQSIYADFSHDNNLAALLPALGLNWETDLPSQPRLDGIPYHKFVVSSLVPFAGRFIFERLIGPDGKHYVRLIINDKVQRLDYIQCGDIGINLGLCELTAFINAQSFARQVPSEWDRICHGPGINKTVAVQP